MKSAPLRHLFALLLGLLVFVTPAMTALAQDGESASPAGMAMLVLFLGIAGIVGVFVIRLSQSNSDDED